MEKFPQIRIKKVDERRGEIKKFVYDNSFFTGLCKNVLNGSTNESEEYRRIITKWLTDMVDRCKQPKRFDLNKGGTEIRELEERILNLTMNESK